MRSSLVIAGLLLTVVGSALFVTLLGAAWLVLVVGGVILIISGFFLKELTERVEPPEGYHFCPFCSTPVMTNAERCDFCGGLQPT